MESIEQKDTTIIKKERALQSWADRKHVPSKRTDVHNLIRGMLEKELKIPANPHKPLVSLGLGKEEKVSNRIV